MQNQLTLNQNTQQESLVEEGKISELEANKFYAGLQLLLDSNLLELQDLIKFSEVSKQVKQLVTQKLNQFEPWELAFKKRYGGTDIDTVIPNPIVRYTLFRTAEHSGIQREFLRGIVSPYLGGNRVINHEHQIFGGAITLITSDLDEDAKKELQELEPASICDQNFIPIFDNIIEKYGSRIIRVDLSSLWRNGERLSLLPEIIQRLTKCKNLVSLTMQSLSQLKPLKKLQWFGIATALSACENLIDVKYNPSSYSAQKCRAIIDFENQVQQVVLQHIHRIKETWCRFKDYKNTFNGRDDNTIKTMILNTLYWLAENEFSIHYKDDEDHNAHIYKCVVLYFLRKIFNNWYDHLARFRNIHKLFAFIKSLSVIERSTLIPSLISLAFTDINLFRPDSSIFKYSIARIFAEAQNNSVPLVIFNAQAHDAVPPLSFIPKDRLTKMASEFYAVNIADDNTIYLWRVIRKNSTEFVYVLLGETKWPIKWTLEEMRSLRTALDGKDCIYLGSQYVYSMVKNQREIESILFQNRLYTFSRALLRQLNIPLDTSAPLYFQALAMEILWSSNHPSNFKLTSDHIKSLCDRGCHDVAILQILTGPKIDEITKDTILRLISDFIDMYTPLNAKRLITLNIDFVSTILQILQPLMALLCSTDEQPLEKNSSCINIINLLTLICEYFLLEPSAKNNNLFHQAYNIILLFLNSQTFIRQISFYNNDNKNFANTILEKLFKFAQLGRPDLPLEMTALENVMKVIELDKHVQNTMKEFFNLWKNAKGDITQLFSLIGESKDFSEKANLCFAGLIALPYTADKMLKLWQEVFWNPANVVSEEIYDPWIAHVHFWLRSQNWRKQTVASDENQHIITICQLIKNIFINHITLQLECDCVIALYQNNDISSLKARYKFALNNYETKNYGIAIDQCWDIIISYKKAKKLIGSIQSTDAYKDRFFQKHQNLPPLLIDTYKLLINVYCALGEKQNDGTLYDEALKSFEFARMLCFKVKQYLPEKSEIDEKITNLQTKIEMLHAKTPSKMEEDPISRKRKREMDTGSDSSEEYHENAAKRPRLT